MASTSTSNRIRDLIDAAREALSGLLAGRPAPAPVPVPVRRR